METITKPKLPDNLIWACEVCGCEELLVQRWVNINSQEIVGAVQDGTQYVYCYGCEDKSDYVSRQTYNDLKNKKR